MAVALKDERIDFRANSNQKILLERAAELKHVSLSSYVLTSSLKQAQIDLAENEVLVLSNRDRDPSLHKDSPCSRDYRIIFYNC